MKKWKIAVLALIIVLSGANLGWWQAWSGSQAEKVSLSEQVSFYRDELKTSETALVDKQSEFDDFKLEKEVEFREIDSNLEDTKTQLDNALDHASLLADELRGVRKELKNQKTYYENKVLEEIKSAKEVGYAEALEREVSRRDPTYDEMWSVLRELAPAINKGIFEIKDNNGVVSCVDFAMLVDNLAEVKGLRTGLVFLVYKYMNGGKWGHFLNSFETSDRSRVYIDYFFSSFDVKGVEIGNYYLGFEDSQIKEIMIAW